MKTFILRKSIIALLIVFTCGLFVSAASTRTYLYDTKEVDGKIVSKVVFLQEDGLLNKEVKYEFSYNEQGKVSEKKAYRWNKATENWDPYYYISFQYDKETGDIHGVYGMWNKTKNDFSLNKQQLVNPASAYDSIFS